MFQGKWIFCIFLAIVSTLSGSPSAVRFSLQVVEGRVAGSSGGLPAVQLRPAPVRISSQAKHPHASSLVMQPDGYMPDVSTAGSARRASIRANTSAMAASSSGVADASAARMLPMSCESWLLIVSIWVLSVQPNTFFW